MLNNNSHSGKNSKQLKISSISQLGLLLKQRRKELGVTQKELAMLCNLSHNGISKIELGSSNIKLSTLLKLGEFLGFEIQLCLEE